MSKRVTLTSMRRIVDALDEKSKSPRRLREEDVWVLRPVRSVRYSNSFLLYSLAWNRVNSARHLALLSIIYDPAALSKTDRHPGSKSTPLILASKIGNNEIAMILVAYSRCAKYINAKDHLGNTALHYACLMHNNDLIKALLIRGASITIKNRAGKKPADYYMQKLEKHGLDYFYGVCPNHPSAMVHVCDWGKTYQGTKQAEFSLYRWFLPHIVTNLGLVSKDDEIELGDSLYVYDSPSGHKACRTSITKLSDAVAFHLKERVPVVDIRIHNAMAKKFKTYHKLNHSEWVVSLFKGGIAPAKSSFGISIKPS